MTASSASSSALRAAPASSPPSPTSFSPPPRAASTYSRPSMPPASIINTCPTSFTSSPDSSRRPSPPCTPWDSESTSTTATGPTANASPSTRTQAICSAARTTAAITARPLATDDQAVERLIRGLERGTALVPEGMAALQQDFFRSLGVFPHHPGGRGGSLLSPFGKSVNWPPDSAHEPFCSALCLQMSESRDRKSTRLNSSHLGISYAVFCLQ